MAEPTARLTRRVQADFADASVVLAELRTIPESLPLGERQDPERMQAALVLPARGDLGAFRAAVALARTDWRDALVAAGLADAGWPARLDTELP